MITATDTVRSVAGVAGVAGVDGVPGVHGVDGVEGDRATAIRAIARRRALAFRGRIAPEVLVDKALRRYDLAGSDEIAYVDVERWLSRTMREIVATEDRRRLGHVSRQPHADDVQASGLAESLAVLLTDVRAPSLAARRRSVARRVFVLLSGRERDVTYALAAGWTAADVARRLEVTDQTVAVIHLRALRRLDQRMSQQLRDDLRRAVSHP